MTIAATRSDDTAVVGLMPKKISRMGVMSAPPPIPVNPTVNPTITEANAMAQSMCIPGLRISVTSWDARFRVPQITQSDRPVPEPDLGRAIHEHLGPPCQW